MRSKERPEVPKMYTKRLSTSFTNFLLRFHLFSGLHLEILASSLQRASFVYFDIRNSTVQSVGESFAEEYSGRPQIKIN